MKTKPPRAEENARDASVPGDPSGSLSLRAKYVLESQRIQDEIGTLDQILQNLGMSQRRACQLLLVDPSAWTRWNKTGAPPHIYQALRWLIQLRKTNPEVTGPVDVTQRLDQLQAKTQNQMKGLETQVHQLERTIFLQSATSSASHMSSDPNVESRLKQVLEQQEGRLQARIAELEKALSLMQQKELIRKPALRRKRVQGKQVGKIRIKRAAKKGRKSKQRQSSIKSSLNVKKTKTPPLRTKPKQKQLPSRLTKSKKSVGKKAGSARSRRQKATGPRKKRRGA